jgi:hypothetical protein
VADVLSNRYSVPRIISFFTLLNCHCSSEHVFGTILQNWYQNMLALLGLVLHISRFNTRIISSAVIYASIKISCVLNALVVYTKNMFFPIIYDKYSESEALT